PSRKAEDQPVLRHEGTDAGHSKAHPGHGGRYAERSVAISVSRSGQGKLGRLGVALRGHPLTHWVEHRAIDGRAPAIGKIGQRYVGWCRPIDVRLMADAADR